MYNGETKHAYSTTIDAMVQFDKVVEILFAIQVYILMKLQLPSVTQTSSMTRTSHCLEVIFFPSDPFYIIFLSITRTMF